MKHIFILISFVVLSTIFFSGCSKNDKSNSSNKNDISQTKPAYDVSVFDENIDDPIKVIYQRNYEYSAIFETEDKEIIDSLKNALNEIEIVSESEMAVDDYDDIITFVMSNGDTHTVRFEYKRLVKNGKRYNVNGYDNVNEILILFSNEE